MAKVVRLKGHEQREWNANMSVLVNEEDGTIVRGISAKESLMMFQMSRQVARTRQPLTETTPEEGSKVEARLEKLPGGAIVVRFYIDGMVIVGGREAMSARILAEHGPCILFRTNGKFLTYIRDPNMPQPSAAEANRTTPRPDLCVCSKWAGRQEGKHHPVCQHNMNAPAEERGEFQQGVGPTANATVMAPTPKVEPKAPPSMLAPGTTLPGFGKKAEGKPPVPAATAVVANSGAPAATPTKQVPHPTACACAKWALPEGVTIDRNREHHPICQWKDEWVVPPAPEMDTTPNAAETPVKQFLVDTNTGVVLREADAEEIQKAAENDGIVIIDNVPYGVIGEDGIEEDGEKPESD